LEDLADKINQVRAESEESANVTIDTTELEQDVSNAEQVVDALKEQLTEKEHELEELRPAVEEIKNRLVEVTARNEKVIADAVAAEEDLQQHLQTKTQREEKLKKTKTKIEAMNEVIAGQERNVQKLERDRDDALLKARKLHFSRDAERKRQEEEDEEDTSTPPSTEELTAEPTQEELEAIEPVQTEKEAAFYQSKIERTKKKIEDEKKRRRLTESDPQVAFDKYMRAQKDLDGNMKQIDAIDDNVELLTDDLTNRRKKWRLFRQHIVDMTNETFNDILNRKGSSGELEFSHDEGTLDLNVQKDSTQESTQTKDVKALSGGERSFTTLALLLALGERLETPFRVMDEFDVFLDPVARKIALDTLVETAKAMVNRQFIFITPQDLSALKTDPLLKIHHMKPPAREGRVGGPSQRTLDFSQGSDE
jgi:chromosome segregation ATPase